jgi:hypothetical protein
LADLFGIERRAGSSFYLRIFECELRSPVLKISLVGLGQLQSRMDRLIEDCLLAACRTQRMIALVRRIAEIGSSIDPFGMILILAGLGLLVSLLFGFDLALLALFDWLA